jgi:two-component system sensor histidine kinase KdpD
MFHSAERGDRRAAGSGLGLAICRGMIGAHGGQVRIGAPAEGSGCVVQILLPLGEGAR